MQPHNIPATNGHSDWSNPGPSRAINVTTMRAAVEALCAKHKPRSARSRRCRWAAAPAS